MGEDGRINWANINDASCQFTMGWDNGNNNLFRFLSSRDSRPWGSTVSYAESHDEQRMGYKSMAYGVTGVKDGGDAYYDLRPARRADAPHSRPEDGMAVRRARQRPEHQGRQRR